MLTLPRIVALATGLALVVTGGAAAQRRGVPSPATGRAYIALIREAWVALAALDVRPADANGAVRAWDRTWRARIDRAPRCAELRLFNPHTCLDAEVAALICNGPQLHLGLAREHIFDQPVQPEHDELDLRLAIADEAARRGRAGLSCEDLPEAHELHRDETGRWVTWGGRPLSPAAE